MYNFSSMYIIHCEKYFAVVENGRVDMVMLMPLVYSGKILIPQLQISKKYRVNKEEHWQFKVFLRIWYHHLIHQGIVICCDKIIASQKFSHNILCTKYGHLEILFSNILGLVIVNYDNNSQFNISW